MKRADDILHRADKAKRFVAPVTETSHLYSDLGYDSLAFVSLLLEIEEAYSIQFDLMEMGKCLRIDRLIALVDRKVNESKPR